MNRPGGAGYPCRVTYQPAFGVTVPMGEPGQSMLRRAGQPERKVHFLACEWWNQANSTKCERYWTLLREWREYLQQIEHGNEPYGWKKSFMLQ